MVVLYLHSHTRLLAWHIDNWSPGMILPPVLLSGRVTVSAILKLTELEADHSPPFREEVNVRPFTSTSPVRHHCMGCCFHQTVMSPSSSWNSECVDLYLHAYYTLPWHVAHAHGLLFARGCRSLGHSSVSNAKVANLLFHVSYLLACRGAYAHGLQFP
jgi:hypothetical protein